MFFVSKVQTATDLFVHIVQSDTDEKRRPRRREAYKSTSSLENGGKKSLLKPKNFEEIQHIVSHLRFSMTMGLFIFGLFLSRKI